MKDPRLDAIREGVLTQMERSVKARLYAIIVAALFEATLLAAALVLINWKDHTQVLLFILALLTYTVTGMGLVALGAHISHSSGRIIAAIQSMEER